MCGLTGGLTLSDFSRLQESLPRMTNALIHRGPDDGGYWMDPQAGIALGHRRLAIVDLSSAGHQPMASASGRWVIAFNGEIYNHRSIRRELEAKSATHLWRGHSDTETLLAGIDAWGVRQALERCIGMFAFAAWDREERTLILGRDRLGEKPLYYGWQGGSGQESFLFGSELVALQQHPGFSGDIDRDALCLFMRHNYVPAPFSIYRGIFKLPPGHLLSVSLSRREPLIEQYWSLPEVAEAGVSAPFLGADEQAVDELERLLKSAIGQQMMADVPLGAFLSGGIDSSVVVALMQDQSERPIQTFSIGFNEAGFDEAVHAKAVARHLRTEHTELYITAQEALDSVPMIAKIYSEPFSDSSQIPTVLLSQLARRKVTVSLSGDGGDELFGGYNRYVQAHNRWRTIERVPASLRKLSGSCLTLVPSDCWNAFLDPMQSIFPPGLRMANVGEKIHKAAEVLSARDVDELYLGLVSHWKAEDVVLLGREPSTYLHGSRLRLQGLDATQRMMALDGITYLPDDILAKVDRAAMSVSLESRVPFLDHRVVELAWRLPQSMKFRDGIGKWVLRQVLHRYVPKELIERPKMGFAVPIGAWLRGPLRDWAEGLLNESRLRQEGYFRPEPIRRKWAEHLSGRRNWQYHLWDVLMFQAWLETQERH